MKANPTLPPLPQGESLTCDRWYDGSLILHQPERGFRATTDAVLLAAAIPAPEKKHRGDFTAIEFGAGSGAVCLALASRLGANAMQITAIERDGLMAALLARNIAENGITQNITPIHADIFDAAAASQWRGHYNMVFANPPYNDAASSLSGDGRRRDAMAQQDGMGAWIEAMLASLKPRGMLVLISRSDRLAAILRILGDNNAGEVTVKPVHSTADSPAIRVLIAARKGVAAPLAILPPLILRDGTRESPELAAISHAKAAIDLSHPARRAQSRG